MDNNQNGNQGGGGKPITTTHIRTLFSSGMSSLTIKFFNVNLSLQMMPFTGKDANGRDQYDRQRSVMTTINFEGAALLLKMAKDVIDGKVEGENVQVDVPCNNNVTVSMVWNRGENGQSSTQLTINKNGQTIPFRFATATYKVRQNGQVTQKIVEIGLDVFAKTLEGYLTGINADRHLDKLTEDFAKSQEANGGGQQGGYQSRNNNYPKKNYGGGNNYPRKNYNNGGGYQNQGQNSTPAPWDNNNQANNTVGISSYSVTE